MSGIDHRGDRRPPVKGVASAHARAGGSCNRNAICNPRFFSKPQRPQASQKGFTYVGVLILLAVMGAALAAFGEISSHAAQRERERELLFVGGQFRDAIASYYHKSPGAKAYPKSLDDLVEDKRFPMPQRHLRRLYRDPITGSIDWGIVEAPGNAGIVGIYSRSEDAPVKSGNFSDRDAAFENAEKYADWKFVYAPTASVRAAKP